MKKLSAFVLIGGVVFGGLMMGCGKNTKTTAQSQADLVKLLQASLSLPLPDNSYASRTGSDIKYTDPTTASNFRALVANVIDPVAKGLKEMNMHLEQTVTDGTRESGNLHIYIAGLPSDLSGTPNDAAGTISWTYKFASNSYFTGTELKTGAGFDLSFPASNSGTLAFTVHMDLSQTDAQTVVKHVSINMPNMGNLVFTETFTNSTTTPSKWHLDGSVNGISPNADWDPTKGGKFTDSAHTPKCFDANLQNVSC